MRFSPIEFMIIIPVLTIIIAFATWRGYELGYQLATFDGKFKEREERIESLNAAFELSLKGNKELVENYGRDVGVCMAELRKVSGKNYWFSGIDKNELIIEGK